MLRHRIQKYPDLTVHSYTSGFLVVFKNFHSGERTKEVADSPDTYGPTEGESAKKKEKF